MRYNTATGMTEKNYITPEGYKRIVDELTELATVERPRVVREVSDAAAEGDRSENAAYIYGKRRSAASSPSSERSCLRLSTPSRSDGGKGA